MKKEHSVGSTGVAQLHYEFTNENNLHTWPNEQLVNRNTKLRNSSYKRFKWLMNKYSAGRKTVSKEELKRMLSRASKQMYYSTYTLRSDNYLGRYKRETGLTILDKPNQKTEAYKVKYSAYELLRNQSPNVIGSDRARLLETISSEIGISVTRLYSAKYEGRWRKEQNKNA